MSLKIKVWQPVLRINFFELAALEPVFLIVGHRAVKNSFAGNTVIANAWIHRRIIRRIKRMTTYPRDGNNIGISLEASIHGPQYVVHIKGVNVFIDQEDVL